MMTEMMIGQILAWGDNGFHYLITYLQQVGGV